MKRAIKGMFERTPGRQGALVLAALVGLLAACEPAAPPPPQASASVPAQPPPQSWPFLEGQAAPAAPREFDPANLMARNYYVVFDASGSMTERKCSVNERKIDVAKRALEDFAAKVPADANLGLVVFDNRGIRQLLPIAPIDQRALASAIAQVRPGSGTPLAEAIRLAYRELTQRAAVQFGYGEYHLVVVTDGEANGEDPRGVVDQLIAQSPVVMHTIGFCIGSDHSLNQPGRTVYRAADNPEALAQGLSEVLAESPSFTVSRFK